MINWRSLHRLPIWHDSPLKVSSLSQSLQQLRQLRCGSGSGFQPTTCEPALTLWGWGRSAIGNANSLPHLDGTATALPWRTSLVPVSYMACTSHGHRDAHGSGAVAVPLWCRCSIGGVPLRYGRTVLLALSCCFRPRLAMGSSISSSSWCRRAGRAFRLRHLRRRRAGSLPRKPGSAVAARS